MPKSRSHKQELIGATVSNESSGSSGMSPFNRQAGRTGKGRSGSSGGAPRGEVVPDLPTMRKRKR